MEREAKYSEPRAHERRDRCVAAFGGDELSVPVDATAENLLGRHASEADLDGGQRPALPGRRWIVVKAAGAPVRKCQDGQGAELFCRAEGVTVDLAARVVAVSSGVSAEAVRWRRLYSFGPNERPDEPTIDGGTARGGE